MTDPYFLLAISTRVVTGSIHKFPFGDLLLHLQRQAAIATIELWIIVEKKWRTTTVYHLTDEERDTLVRALDLWLRHTESDRRAQQQAGCWQAEEAANRQRDVAQRLHQRLYFAPVGNQA